MRFLKKTNKYLIIVENAVFLCGFIFIMYRLLARYGNNITASIHGGGFLGAITQPLARHQYYTCFVWLMVTLNSGIVLWEIFSLIVSQLRRGKKNGATYRYNYKSVLNKIALHYKSPFLSLIVSDLLPKVILLHMFWTWMPHFKKLEFFTVNLKWYSWIYGYVCWEFSSWLFHFSSHRVRILWCLHSPHHAPSELNMTVNWLHFFAESYYSTFVRLLILMLFGVDPAMFVPVILIDSVWGVFIHVSERTIKNGRLGFLQHIIITPAHHRVHHAKNPLYLDTNFANVFPLWDWLLGTLQPIKDEVKPNYGISRELDVTNFSNLYFGEFLLLYRDIKNARGIRNKLSYIFMPPGWSPSSAANTAAAKRNEFLMIHPELGITTRERLLHRAKSYAGRTNFRSQKKLTEV